MIPKTMARPPFGNVHKKHFGHMATQFSHFQPKFDGWFAYMVVEPTGEFTIINRGGRVYDKGKLLGRVSVELPRERIVFVGEMMMGTNWVTRHPEHAGKFYCFDCLEADGQQLLDRPWRERLLVAGAYLALIDEPSWLQMIHVLPVQELATWWEAHVEEGDWEGVVFRNPEARWNTGMKRAKKVVTQEYVVIGMGEGGGRLKGTMGKLKVALWNPETKQLRHVSDIGGGFSDSQRRVWWNDRLVIAYNALNRNYGKLPVIEVKGNDLFAGGAMRHPQFLRVRDDKAYTECI